MIKLNRSGIDIPKSLDSRNIRARRLELIEKGCWINDRRYITPFKKSDVRAGLMKMSSSKCSFCEQILNIATTGSFKDDEFTREHFRPKSKYWWLAYSWDNLLPICRKCNGIKADIFEINGSFRNYHPSDLSNIHALAADYHAIEQPNYLHPEHGADPEPLLTFTDGMIYSSDTKAQNTINAYDLNRRELLLLRNEIYEAFMDEYTDILYSEKTPEDKKADIESIYKTFLFNMHDSSNSFLAFRRYIAQHDIRNLVTKPN